MRFQLLVVLFFIMQSLNSCKFSNTKQKESGPVNPKVTVIQQQPIIDNPIIAVEKLEQKSKPDLEILFINLEGMDIPTFKILLLEDTYLKYTACNDSNQCVSNSSFDEHSSAINLPEGNLNINYRICLAQNKATVASNKNCSRERILKTYYKRTLCDTAFCELFEHLDKYTSKLRSNATNLYTSIQFINDNFEKCVDKNNRNTLSESEIKSIKELSTWNEEKILEAISVAGNLGQLADLADLIEERIKKEEEKKEKILEEVEDSIEKANKVIAVLSAGIGLLTSQTILKPFGWVRFLHNQRYLKIQGKKIGLTRNKKNDTYLSIKEKDLNKLDGLSPDEKNKFLELKFYEDPLIFRTYLVKDSDKLEYPDNIKIGNDLRLYTNNEKKVELLDVIELEKSGYKLHKHGVLTKEGITSEVFLPRRKDGLLEQKVEPLQATTSQRVKKAVNLQDTYRNDIEFKTLRKQYFKDLEGALHKRHMGYPITSRFNKTRHWGRLYAKVHFVATTLALLIPIITFSVKKSFSLTSSRKSLCSEVKDELSSFQTEFSDAKENYDQVEKLTSQIYYHLN